MINFNVPKVENYEKDIPIQIWGVYSRLMLNNNYKVEMDIFENREKAVQVIKDYLDRGAITFSHFTEDYDKFVIFRDTFTDEVIKEKRNAKKKKETEDKMTRDGKEK